MSKNTKRTEEDNTRTAGSTVGGAILGASLGGPFGAVIGGLVGAFLGESVNDSKRSSVQGKNPSGKSTPQKSKKPTTNNKGGDRG